MSCIRRKPTAVQTRHGLIGCIYKNQKCNAKVRGHSVPDYTKPQLTAWLYLNGFEALYQAWERSGFCKWLRPSVDRIDSKQSYFFGNIELVTWRENFDRNSVELGRPVRSSFGESFYSISAAFKGVGHSIDYALKNGTTDKTGRRWEFVGGVTK